MRACLLILVLGLLASGAFAAAQVSAQVINGETPYADDMLNRQTPEPAAAVAAREPAAARASSPARNRDPAIPTNGRRE